MDMKTPSITETDLIRFFGSEHTSRTYGDVWYDSDSLYEFTDERDIRLTCAIHPVHGDVRITLSVQEEQFYDLQLVGIQDISYREEREKAYIDFIITDYDRLELSVEPKISIKRKTEPVAKPTYRAQ